MMRSPASQARRLAGENARDDFVPVRGWVRGATLDLVPALRAVQKADVVDDVLEYAGDSVEFAERQLRKHGGRDPGGLNLQQIAAFNLYTKENVGNPEASFFRVLNTALSSMNCSEVLPFFGYLKLFIEGARLLPNACPQDLWRAFPTLDPEWATVYPKDKELFWWGFTSTTKDSDALSNPNFFGADGQRTLFLMHCVSGIDISAYSDFPEAEVLLMPGSKFVVEPWRRICLTACCKSSFTKLPGATTCSARRATTKTHRATGRLSS